MARDVPVELLLRDLGIKAVQRGRKWVATCPHPDHADKDPSWFIRDDPGSQTHSAHHCFSCKFGGGPWELVAAVRGVTLAEAGEIVLRISGGEGSGGEVDVPVVRVREPTERGEYALPAGVRIPSLDGTEWNPAALSYLLDRGVTEQQIERWRIGYAVNGPLAWRVVIPVHTGGRLVAHVARSIFDDGSPRYDMPHGGRVGSRSSAALLGEPLFDRSLGIVTIAEGSFSMLALERAGAINPCAMLGSNMTPERSLMLGGGWRAVLVATDPDKAGDRIAEEIWKTVGRRSAVVRVRLDQSPDDSLEDVLRERLAEALAVAEAEAGDWS